MLDMDEKEIEKQFFTVFKLHHDAVKQLVSTLALRDTDSPEQQAMCLLSLNTALSIMRRMVYTLGTEQMDIPPEMFKVANEDLRRAFNIDAAYQGAVDRAMEMVEGLKGQLEDLKG